MPRKDKLTQAVHAQIVDLVREGNFDCTAAHAAGISRETFRQWMKRGQEEPNGKFQRFHRDVSAAAALAEVDAVHALKGFWEKDWRAIAYYLSHKCRERWRKDPELITTTANEDPFEGRSVEELDYYIEHGHFPERAPREKLNDF